MMLRLSPSAVYPDTERDFTDDTTVWPCSPVPAHPDKWWPVDGMVCADCGEPTGFCTSVFDGTVVFDRPFWSSNDELLCEGCGDGLPRHDPDWCPW